MQFVRWPSIENTYNSKFIEMFLDEFPELDDETYVVTEKIHGANLQLGFAPGETMLIGSRTHWLDVDERFYDAQAVIGQMYATLAPVQDTVNKTGVSIRLFGELHGQGIQKGVNYGKGHKIRFFGMMKGDELQPFSALLYYRELWGWDADLLVPIVGSREGLHAALSFDTAFSTRVGDAPCIGNLCEGVVIQPLTEVYRCARGDTFLLKNKNEAFKEKVHQPKPPRPANDVVGQLNDLFADYLTEERMHSTFSKVGPIDEPKQIGDYIRLILADAQEDFLSEHDEQMAALDKGQQKLVYNVGSTVAKMLQEYMRSGKTEKEEST